MNRRSFFQRLLGAAAAITVASAVECFGVADKVVEATKKVRHIIVNPAYLTAQFDDIIIFSPSVGRCTNVVRCAVDGPKIENAAPDLRPLRYNLEDGNFVQVPFYKEI